MKATPHRSVTKGSFAKFMKEFLEGFRKTTKSIEEIAESVEDDPKFSEQAKAVLEAMKAMPNIKNLEREYDNLTIECVELNDEYIAVQTELDALREKNENLTRQNALQQNIERLRKKGQV